MMKKFIKINFLILKINFAQKKLNHVETDNLKKKLILVSILI
jgi:hypothetical protein